MQVLAVVNRPIVHEANGDRAPGDGAAHAFAEMQRRAALKRCVHGVTIDVAHVCRRVWARIGRARRGDHLAVALEGEADGVFRAVPRLVLRRRDPARA